jgi:hypothetical protein
MAEQCNEAAPLNSLAASDMGIYSGCRVGEGTRVPFGTADRQQSLNMRFKLKAL